MRIVAVALIAVGLVGCAQTRPGPLPGIDRAEGSLSGDARELIKITLFDKTYYGRYAVASQRNAVPENFGGTKSLARSDLEFGGQGNARATLSDSEGAPLYCLFDLEQATFSGQGECQDREGRLYDLVLAAN